MVFREWFAWCHVLKVHRVTACVNSLSFLFLSAAPFMETCVLVLGLSVDVWMVPAAVTRPFLTVSGATSSAAETSRSRPPSLSVVVPTLWQRSELQEEKTQVLPSQAEGEAVGAAMNEVGPAAHSTEPGRGVGERARGFARGMEAETVAENRPGRVQGTEA